jgi:hypothetical protein
MNNPYYQEHFSVAAEPAADPPPRDMTLTAAVGAPRRQLTPAGNPPGAPTGNPAINKPPFPKAKAFATQGAYRIVSVVLLWWMRHNILFIHSETNSRRRGSSWNTQ